MFEFTLEIYRILFNKTVLNAKQLYLHLENSFHCFFFSKGDLNHNTKIPSLPRMVECTEI